MKSFITQFKPRGIHEWYFLHLVILFPVAYHFHTCSRCVGSIDRFFDLIFYCIAIVLVEGFLAISFFILLVCYLFTSAVISELIISYKKYKETIIEEREYQKIIADRLYKIEEGEYRPADEVYTDTETSEEN